MMHTSKMILVPSQMVNKETGAENLMSSLDNAMKRILDDKKLPSDAKLAQYTQILHRYQKTGEEHKKPFKIEVQEPIPEETLKDEEILHGIPTKFIKKAESLLECVKKNSHIKWSKDNQLIVDGVKFPGTNKQDLIHDFSRERKTHDPVKGAEAFGKALAKSNVPKSVIGNKYRHELLDEQEPLVFSTPTNDKQLSAHKMATPQNTRELSEHKTIKSRTNKKWRDAQAAKNRLARKLDKAPPLQIGQPWDSVFN